MAERSGFVYAARIAKTAEPAHRPPSYGEETLCGGCGKTTLTIGGRCPECGEVKDSRRLPTTAPGPVGGFWEELDDWLQSAIIIAPVLTLAVVGAIFLAPEIGIVAGVLIVLYVLANGFFDLF